MRTNYHTHTKYCRHAEGGVKDYTAAAVERGLMALGFSDHGPFPDLDPGLRMLYPELPEYLKDVAEAKVKYDGIIRLYTGLEIEYLPGRDSYYKKLYEEYGIDYLVLGEHFFETPDGTKNIYNAAGTQDYLEYAGAIAAGIASGFFQVVAHPDLMLLNLYAWDDNCEAAARLIVEAAAEYDCVLEYNANGYRRGKSDYPDGSRYMYPDPRFWERVADTRIRVLVNADAHSPDHIWDDAMDLALKDAKALSLNLIEDLNP